MLPHVPNGMFEVFAMRIVRSMSERPVRGRSGGETRATHRSSRSPVHRIHVDDDVGVAPAGDGVLGHRLARAESAGIATVPHLPGKEHVDDPLPVIKGIESGFALGYRPVTRMGHRCNMSG